MRIKNKNYVYRLKHKPTNQYFQEICTDGGYSRLRVILSPVGERFFTSSAQLNKMWSKLEEFRMQVIASEKWQVYDNDYVREGREKFAECEKILSEMEVEVIEMLPIKQTTVLKKELLADSVKQHALAVFKFRLSEITNSNLPYDVTLLYDALEKLEAMQPADNYTFILQLSSNKKYNLEKSLGIELLEIQPYSHRLVAAKQTDLHLIQLTNNESIQVYFNIEEAYKLKNQIFKDYGLF